jgi:nucleoside-diphosphate-sugar epimerase
VIRYHSPTPSGPRRVVVLGASGFVGTKLIEDFRARGIATLPLSSAQLDLTGPSAAGSLRDAVTDGDALVFAAALTPDKGNNVRSLMRNLAMAEALASLEECPCSHLVYLSSDAVHDGAESLIRETTRPVPATLYGHMHLLREKILAQAAERWGCPFLVLRPCAIYGPGDTHNSYGPNRFLSTAAADQRITLFGHGEELRDHLFVGDLVRLLGLVLAHGTEGLLNVATGRSTSFQAVANLVSGMFDRVVTIEHQARQAPISHRHFDISTLIRAFPTFRFTELSDGLRLSLEAREAVQAA